MGLISGTEEALHEHQVQPAAEFDAHFAQRAGPLEAEALMQAKGAGIRLVDPRHHDVLV